MSRRYSRALIIPGFCLLAAAQQGSQIINPGIGGPINVPAYSDYTGFTKLWDGQTFNNWDGETDVWSIENGAIHADTVKTPGQHHVHYTGPGAVMHDFDLRVEMKMSEKGANGGIQYRSRLMGPGHGGSMTDPMGKNLPANIHTLQQAIDAGITSATTVAPTNPVILPANPGPGCPAPPPPAAPPAAAAGRAPARAPQPPNPWQMSGYQFDMSSDNRYTGQLYEGQGRGIVAPPGIMVLLGPCRVSTKLGTVNANPTAAIHEHKGADGEWNQIEIIARGNTLIHMMNGQVISIAIDENAAERAASGILSLQLEGSGQIWYRNVYVKPLN